MVVENPSTTEGVGSRHAPAALLGHLGTAAEKAKMPEDPNTLEASQTSLPAAPATLRQDAETKEPDAAETPTAEPAAETPQTAQLARPTADSVRLTFEANGSTKNVQALRRPLQLTFDMQVPIRVAKSDGHSAELGVREDWILQAVDGHPVAEDFHVFYADFIHRLNALSGDYLLPLLFQRLDGSRWTIAVPTRPLGLTLGLELPTYVREVSGAALQLGIGVGWQLLRFADKDVASYDSFPAFLEEFSRHLELVCAR